MNKERNICIVGLGLLGGSYAMGLTDAGYTVTAVDVRPEAIRYALEKGIIAAGAVEDFAPLLAGADAVVLGLYPVSYTHLDVYKRQPTRRSRRSSTAAW